MHEASSKPSRSNIKIQVGPVSLNVDVFSGTYNAPSPTKACIGTATAEHEPKKLTPGSSTSASCTICGTSGTVKAAHPGANGKLTVVADGVALKALEASAEHRDTMPLIRVPFSVLEANALESAEVYWLAPSDGPNPLYAGMVEAVGASAEAIITRWSPQKNVFLFRLVARAGVLGMVKLVAAETLRAAPNEPISLSESEQQKALQMAVMALGMAPSVSAEELVEISGNPYTEIITEAATKAIESGAKTVRIAHQNRTSFGDNLAAAALAAMLEGAEL